MRTVFGQIPFFRLLLPVVTAISVCAFFTGFTSGMFIPGICGLLLMLLSFFIPENWQFGLKWLFGAGLFLFLFSLTAFQYSQQAKKTDLPFSGAPRYYIATILDIPEAKPRSIAHNVRITYPANKKVIIYFEKGADAWKLKPGDEIVFYSTIEPFKNLGNPDDFNYKRFMRIKGFSGSGYVAGSNWKKTGREVLTIPVLSQRLRVAALNFYRSFGLSPDGYAFISALTLGYKAGLTDNLQEAFRASGTAHVLAVSGLHAGIIYLVINFLFSFLGNHGKRYIARQCLVIIALWGYVFVTGMSPSVIRAAIMLTINCMGKIFNRRGFTYNTLAAAALFILIYRPFTLFDVSFQMSFGAVFAILFFQPKFLELYNPPGRVARYFWSTLTISLSAQLGVFPLVLHYFGTFPTYFFISNIVVVPMVSLIIYATAPLVVVNLLSHLQLGFISLLQSIFQAIVKILLEFTLRVVYFIEMLPFAQLSNHYISFLQLVLVLIFIYLFATHLYTRRPRPLIIALLSAWGFILTITYNSITKSPPELVVFNNPHQGEIGIYANNKRYLTGFTGDGFIPHPNRRIFHASGEEERPGVRENIKVEKSREVEKITEPLNSTKGRKERFKLDVLILSNNRKLDNGKLYLYQLLRVFNPSIVVIDSSISGSNSAKIRRECSRLGINVHDVKKDGAFSLKF